MEQQAFLNGEEQAIFIFAEQKLLITFSEGTK
jgi:hypothetical protein